MQDVSTTSLAGGIRVTGHFINNSGAVGLLIIVYSLTREAEIQYTFSQRPKEQQETEKILTGLSDGDYQTSVFVVDKSGLPFEQVASLPSNVSISDSEGMKYSIVSLVRGKLACIDIVVSSLTP